MSAKFAVHLPGSVEKLETSNTLVSSRDSYSLLATIVAVAVRLVVSYIIARVPGLELAINTICLASCWPMGRKIFIMNGCLMHI